MDGSISVDLGRLGCLVLRMVVQEGGQRGASLKERGLIHELRKGIGLLMS